MRDRNEDTKEGTPRRNFFGIAAVSALGLFGLSTAARAQPAPAGDGPDWPGVLKGRHKALFDIYDINEGFPLGFVNNFLTPNESATAVMVCRHKGLPYAVGSAMWGKYKIGETFNIIDPETKMHAVKNPYYEPKAGIGNPNAALDRLIARGAVMGACGVALRGQSGRASKNAGVTPEEAFKEWSANLLPGVFILPSGTWGVNRAQEAGCTYCAGGVPSA